MVRHDEFRLNFQLKMHGKGSERKKNLVDYKARLERKLCIARENPEPVFDLSDCNLKQVPSNIFSLCRVFRKDALILQDNQLSNLSPGGSLSELKDLKILNISFNKFTILPNSINSLKSLEILDVSNNQLTKLPPEIGDLENLKYLNLSVNNLKSLPDSLGNCQNLEELYLLFNESLKEIPATLGKLNKLEKLEIDSNIFYPPREIFQSGISNTIEFLRNELNNGLENPSTSNNNYTSKDNKVNKHSEGVKQSVYTAEKQKLMDMNIKNLKLHTDQEEAKSKLLNNIKNEQEALDKKLEKIQAQKSMDRALLIQMCQKEEKESCDAIKRILENNSKIKSNCLEAYERERKEEEEKLIYNAMMKNINKPSERQHILDSMDEIMRGEIKKYQMINEKKKLGIIESLAAEMTFENEALKKLMKKNDENKKQLVDSILANEELQKSAVVSLLEASDVVSWEFSRQISIVEAKLAELTQLELLKKKTQTEHQLVELSKDRIELTRVLTDLFEKQTARSKELINRIRQMEAIREEKKSVNDYWLEQYNILLHSKSNEMVKYLESVHSDLVYQLFVYGVFHYLPLLKEFVLSEKKMDKMTSKNLKEVGIDNLEDRENILKAVKNFLREEQARRKTPSAPDIAEAKTFPSNTNADKPFQYTVQEECVICLDLKPNIIFIPCGHVCTCYKCSVPVSLCPICRRPILQKHETIFS